MTQVTWVNDRGGSGTATGTTSWTVSGIVLLSGANVLTVTARDAAGNTSTDHADGDLHAGGHDQSDGDDHGADEQCRRTRVTTTPLSIERDGLGQRGRDAGELGERPGRQRHGDRDDAWSVSGIALLSGANVLTVTARDAAGNTSTDHADGDLHAARTRRSRR